MPSASPVVSRVPADTNMVPVDACPRKPNGNASTVGSAASGMVVFAIDHFGVVTNGLFGIAAAEVDDSVFDTRVRARKMSIRCGGDATSDAVRLSDESTCIVVILVTKINTNIKSDDLNLNSYVNFQDYDENFLNVIDINLLSASRILLYYQKQLGLKESLYIKVWIFKNLFL